MKDTLEKTSKKVTSSQKLKLRLIWMYITLLTFSVIVALVVKLFDAGSSFFAVIKQRESIIQILALTVLNMAVLSALLFYITLTKRDILINNKFICVLVTSFLLTFAVAILFGKLISIYAMPLALSGLLIAILVDRRIALMSNIFVNIAFFLCFLVIYDIREMLFYAVSLFSGIISGTYMILLMEKTYTRMRFLLNGLIITLLIVPISMLSMAVISINVADILFAGLWSFISVLAAVSLFIIVLPIFEKIFRLTTNFGLEEICSFDARLLKRLSREAPGTFNHSLAVGNLAQLCALAIGENPQLAKAAAYYHDVGKLKEPLCFAENQKGYNPHDDFIPEVSVNVITQHTRIGYELIKKENLPDSIANIALEHHGTTPVNYFYNKVKKITEELVERRDFSYSGPIPSSRISAIIMIVDTVEAATRTQNTADIESLRGFIHKLIDEKRQLGQFDNCNLTFKQLKKIEDTLVEAMPGIYHSRIPYDE